MQVKHTWHVSPANFEILGHPDSTGTTIDLHIAQAATREYPIYAVGDPGQGLI